MLHAGNTEEGNKQNTRIIHQMSRKKGNRFKNSFYKEADSISEQIRVFYFDIQMHQSYLLV